MAITLAKIAAKISVAGGVVYWSIQQGIWGNSREGAEAGKRLSKAIIKPAEKYVKKMPSITDVNTSARGYWNSGMSSLFTNISQLPEVGKACSDTVSLTISDWNRAVVPDPKSIKGVSKSAIDVTNKRKVDLKTASPKLTTQEWPDYMRQAKIKSPEIKIPPNKIMSVVMVGPTGKDTNLQKSKSPEKKLPSVESATMKGNDNLVSKSPGNKLSQIWASSESFVLRGKDASVRSKSLEKNLLQNLTRVDSTVLKSQDANSRSKSLEKYRSPKLTNAKFSSPKAADEGPLKSNSFKLSKTPTNNYSVEAVICCRSTTPEKFNKTEGNSKQTTPRRSLSKRSNTFEAGQNYITSLVSPPRAFLKLPNSMRQSSLKSSLSIDCSGNHNQEFSNLPDIFDPASFFRTDSTDLIQGGSPILLCQLTSPQRAKNHTFSPLFKADDKEFITSPTSPCRRANTQTNITRKVIENQLKTPSPCSLQFTKIRTDTSPLKQAPATFDPQNFVPPILVNNINPFTQIDEPGSSQSTLNFSPRETLNLSGKKSASGPHDTTEDHSPSLPALKTCTNFGLQQNKFTNFSRDNQNTIFPRSASVTPTTFRRTSLIHNISPWKSKIPLTHKSPKKANIKPTSSTNINFIDDMALQKSTFNQNHISLLKTPVHSNLSSLNDSFVGALSPLKAMVIEDDLIYMNPFIKPTAYVTGGLVSIISPPKSVNTDNRPDISQIKVPPTTTFMNGGFSLRSPNKLAFSHRTSAILKSSPKSVIVACNSPGHLTAPKTPTVFEQKDLTDTPCGDTALIVKKDSTNTECSRKPYNSPSHLSAPRSPTVFQQKEPIDTPCGDTALIVKKDSIPAECFQKPVEEFISKNTPHQPLTISANGGFISILSPSTPTFMAPSIDKKFDI